MTKTAIVTVKKDSTEKEKLSFVKTLARKKHALIAITATVEMLRMDLDIIKREYDVRIGKLYLKDDQLDLEIIRYNRIKELLQEGYSYDDAVKEIDKLYYEERKIFDIKFEEITEEEALFEKRKQLYTPQEQDVKKLWKKLLFQLHPDLVSDSTEKKRRENIMRKINDAYEENDYDALKHIENQHFIESPDDMSLEKLEERIVEIENAIIAHEKEIKSLRASEWFMWKKKSNHAKIKHIDLFKELEGKLLEDIARKIKIVHGFREEFDQKGYV